MRHTLLSTISVCCTARVFLRDDSLLALAVEEGVATAVSCPKSLQRLIPLIRYSVNDDVRNAVVYHLMLQW